MLVSVICAARHLATIYVPVRTYGIKLTTGNNEQKGIVLRVSSGGTLLC